MPEVVLYGQPGCHLCEDAEAALEALRRSRPFALRVVDINSDDDLARRYVFEIPVIEVDGAVVTRAPVDLRAVTAALDAPASTEGRR
ncbi:MAG: glutaredoxin family protein [Dehalococcoidia bacterium]|nr:glutaredoxin family protein [Dehalococcoidia bacterium]